MPSRDEITAAMKQKLDESRKALDELKAKMDRAEGEASEELHEAVDKAEGVLAKGRARLKELSEASDEKFDEMWADTKESWHEVSADIERHWDHLSDRVKRFFS